MTDVLDLMRLAEGELTNGKRTLIKVLKNVEPLDGGHLIWTGGRNSGSDLPVVWECGGREVGVRRWLYSFVVRPLEKNERAMGTCKHYLCVTPDHVAAIPRRNSPSRWSRKQVKS